MRGSNRDDENLSRMVLYGRGWQRVVDITLIGQHQEGAKAVVAVEIPIEKDGRKIIEKVFYAEILFHRGYDINPSFCVLNFHISTLEEILGSLDMIVENNRWEAKMLLANGETIDIDIRKKEDDYYIYINGV